VGAFSGARAFGVAKFAARYRYRGRHSASVRNGVVRHRYVGAYGQAKRTFSASNSWAFWTINRGIGGRFADMWS
jgi:hypothetical protein